MVPMEVELSFTQNGGPVSSSMRLFSSVLEPSTLLLFGSATLGIVTRRNGSVRTVLAFIDALHHDLGIARCS
jgi:hypothetical protein